MPNGKVPGAQEHMKQAMHEQCSDQVRRRLYLLHWIPFKHNEGFEKANNSTGPFQCFGKRRKAPRSGILWCPARQASTRPNLLPKVLLAICGDNHLQLRKATGGFWVPRRARPLAAPQARPSSSASPSGCGKMNPDRPICNLEVTLRACGLIH